MRFLVVVVLLLLLLLSAAVPIFLIERVLNQSMTDLLWWGGVSALAGIFASAMLLLR